MSIRGVGLEKSCVFRNCFIKFANNLSSLVVMGHHEQSPSPQKPSSPKHNQVSKLDRLSANRFWFSQPRFNPCTAADSPRQEGFRELYPPAESSQIVYAIDLIKDGLLDDIDTVYSDYEVQSEQSEILDCIDLTTQTSD